MKCQKKMSESLLWPSGDKAAVVSGSSNVSSGVLSLEFCSSMWHKGAYSAVTVPSPKTSLQSHSWLKPVPI